MILALTAGLGLLIGLSLGALGGGGSILTVPALVYVIGQDAKAATTSSLFIVGLGALVGALGHHRSGRVRWGTGLAFGAAGIAAGFAGTALNRHVQPDVLLLAFAGLILVAAAGMFAKNRAAARRAEPSAALVAAGGDARNAVPPGPTATPDRESAPRRSPGRGRVAKVLAAGLAVGFLTGFFGVGGGFVIVPTLVLVLAFPAREAVGTSLVVVSLASLLALVPSLRHGRVEWATALPFAAGGALGALLGSRISRRLPEVVVRRAFALALVALAAFVLSRNVRPSPPQMSSAAHDFPAHCDDSRQWSRAATSSSLRRAS